jgi:CBS domain-containing protein
VKEKTMNETKVKDVMTRLVVTFRPEDDITEAARRLTSNRISGAPVVESGRLVGVVSEADILKAHVPIRRGWRYRAPHPLEVLLQRAPMRDVRGATVGEVMTTDVFSISSDASIFEAAFRIDRHGVRRLPVVDEDGYVVGVVTRSDLVRCMAIAGRNADARPPLEAVH